MTDDKTAGLRQAREQRSLEKRRAVERAIDDLKSRDEPVTFKAVATSAGVSRQYLYNNFKEAISAYREDGRAKKTKIDGVIVPTRTPEEARHVEALLRNKMDRLKKDLGSARQENTRLKLALEKERGMVEHFRQLWVKAKA